MDYYENYKLCIDKTLVQYCCIKFSLREVVQPRCFPVTNYGHLTLYASPFALTPLHNQSQFPKSILFVLSL